GGAEALQYRAPDVTHGPASKRESCVLSSRSRTFRSSLRRAVFRVQAPPQRICGLAVCGNEIDTRFHLILFPNEIKERVVVEPVALLRFAVIALCFDRLQELAPVLQGLKDMSRILDVGEISDQVDGDRLLGDGEGDEDLQLVVDPTLRVELFHAAPVVLVVTLESGGQGGEIA